MHSTHAMLPIVAAAIVAAAAEGYNAMRPTASVGGAYGLMADATPPTPEPAGGCVDGCPCGGTGKERSGDGIIEFDCRCPEGCECKGAKAKPVKMRKLYRMPGPRWNWEGISDPSESFMRQHLLLDHGIDATGWSREAMQVGHDNLHNGHDVWGEEPSASCPDGKCPVPSSSIGGCPGGNCPTTPRRRGIFRR